MTMGQSPSLMDGGGGGTGGQMPTGGQGGFYGPGCGGPMAPGSAQMPPGTPQQEMPNNGPCFKGADAIGMGR